MAAGRAVGNLLVRIGADVGGLRKGGKRGEKTLQRMSREAKETSVRLGKLASAAAAAGAVIAAELTRRGMESVTAQQRMAKSLGATNREVAGLTAAFKTYRLEQDDVADALGTITDRAQDAASGQESMADDFRLVGLEIANLRGKKPTELFNQFAQAIADTEDPSKRTAAAVRIFGDDLGRKLMPLLMQGPEALQRFTQQAEDLGIAVSAVEGEQVERASRAMSRIQQASEGVANQMAAELSPIIIGVADLFTDAASESNGFRDQISRLVDTSINGFAFVADAVESVIRLFEAGGQAAATGALMIVRNMTRAAEAIMSGPVDAINALIRTANQIPGINFGEVEQPDIVTGLQAEVAQAERAVEEGKKAIRETLMEPLPGESIRQWADRVRDETRRAAEEVVENQKRMATPPSEGDEGGDSEEKKKHIEKLQSRIDRIREANMSERELMLERQQQEIDSLNKAKSMELETEVAWDERIRETKSRHENELTKLEKQASDARKRIAETEAENKRRIMGDALAGLTTLMNSESRKMFKIGKVAAISQSIVSTYQGMTKALELGWPMGPIAAAAIGASGFANVASIQSQSFGGGGGGGRGASSNTQQVNADRERVGDAGGGSLILNVQGSGNMVDIEQIAQGLGSYLEDGGTIGSVQMRRS